MKITTIHENDVEIAVINSNGVLITDVQSALDLFATVQFTVGCSRIILNRSAICEDFFRLSTRLAGDILQKLVNYQMKMAVIGEFSTDSSKCLRDFIYESNNGRDVFFLTNEKEAAEKLSTV